MLPPHVQELGECFVAQEALNQGQLQVEDGGDQRVQAHGTQLTAEPVQVVKSKNLDGVCACVRVCV